MNSLMTIGLPLRSFCRLCFLTLLLLSTQPAWADNIQVTFTGEIYFTFDQEFGGPSFHGIQNGDSFSSVLTYDPSQPNLGVPGQGLYGVYDYRVTVQTAAGPVTLGGPISWPCPNCAFSPLQVLNDFPDEFGTADILHNAGSDVDFIFKDYTHTALAGDSLADVDWQNLLTLSSIPQPFVRAPNGAIVPNGSVRDMFLRNEGAAVVVIGRISAVDVQVIPVPEPSSTLLLALGFVGILLQRRRVEPES